MTKSFKDKISNYAALAGVVAGSILTAGATAELPKWLMLIAGIIASASVGVVGYLTGKGGDGKKKPPVRRYQ